jgi:hypothetical protein
MTAEGMIQDSFTGVRNVEKFSSHTSLLKILLEISRIKE